MMHHPGKTNYLSDWNQIPCEHFMVLSIRSQTIENTNGFFHQYSLLKKNYRPPYIVLTIFLFQVQNSIICERPKLNFKIFHYIIGDKVDPPLKSLHRKSQ